MRVLQLTNYLSETSIEVPAHPKTTPEKTEKEKTFISSCKRLFKKKKNCTRMWWCNYFCRFVYYEIHNRKKEKCNGKRWMLCIIWSRYIGKKLKTFDTRTRAILINEINNVIFKTEMNIQILPIRYIVEEPRITTSYPVPVTSYQQPQSSMHSLESFYGVSTTI